MTSSARVGTRDAHGLANRMANHFGHKVRVEREEDEVRISLPTGAASLRVEDAVLTLAARADDEPALARVEEVVASHLVRFARGEPIEVSWRRD